MKTAREIYRRSLALIGEEEGENSAVFEGRLLPLVNVLLGEMYELDLAVKGEKTALGESAPQIRSLDEEIWLEDSLIFSVMPLGRAAFLLGETEPERANYFQQLYQRERETVRVRCRRGRRHKITRPY